MFKKKLLLFWDVSDIVNLGGHIGMRYFWGEFFSKEWTAKQDPFLFSIRPPVSEVHTEPFFPDREMDMTCTFQGSVFHNTWREMLSPWNFGKLMRLLRQGGGKHHLSFLFQQRPGVLLYSVHERTSRLRQSHGRVYLSQTDDRLRNLNRLRKCSEEW